MVNFIRIPNGSRRLSSSSFVPFGLQDRVVRNEFAVSRFRCPSRVFDPIFPSQAFQVVDAFTACSALILLFSYRRSFFRMARPPVFFTFRDASVTAPAEFLTSHVTSRGFSSGNGSTSVRQENGVRRVWRVSGVTRE